MPSCVFADSGERSVSEKQHSGNPEVFGGVTRRTEAMDSCEGGKAVTGRLGSDPMASRRNKTC